MTRASHYLRTVCAFVLFALGGLVLSCAVMPLIWLVTRDRAVAMLRSQRTLRAGFRLFFRILAGLRLFKTAWPLDETLTPSEPSVIVCNHPCLLDTVAMTIRYANTLCLVKQSYYDNPLFYGLAKACGFLPAGRTGSVHTHRRTLIATISALEQGYSVIVFPEGRRSPVDGRIPFGRGACEIAAQAAAPVIPVRLACSPRSLAREIPLHRMPLCCVTHSAVELPSVRVEPGRANTRAATQAIQDLLQPYKIR